MTKSSGKMATLLDLSVPCQGFPALMCKK